MMFTKYINCWLNENNYFDCSDILIMLNNSSIHKTVVIKDKNLRLMLIYSTFPSIHLNVLL